VGTQVVFLTLVAQVTWPALPIPSQLPWVTMLVVTLVTVGSFVDYFVGNLHILRAAWADEPA
jgi:hypothetical protein